MAQDIRELLRDDKKINVAKMPEGHEKRFEQMLSERLPEKRKHDSFFFLKIAASIAVILSIGITAYRYTQPAGKLQTIDIPANNTADNVSNLTLGDLSPEMKKIENYYLVNINLELSDLQVDDENKQLLDGYLQRLAELNDEYKNLTRELNEIGPNDQTINALIDNLQMRLQLLYRLKDKLNELKHLDNETPENQKA